VVFMSIEFWLTALIVSVTPGTGVLLTVAAGLTHGSRAGVITAVGCTLGVVPHMLAAVTGIALLLSASPIAFAALKWAGVGYLLYMAISMLRGAGHVRADEPVAPSARQAIVKAVLANLLNPKLTIFFFAFLPQFVNAHDPGASQAMLLLGVVFMAVTFVVFAGYAFGAAAVREKIISRPKVLAAIERVFAVSFVALGARLALT
jgi:threonine/homoserine/homoserine lactone efflux protein